MEARTTKLDVEVLWQPPVSPRLTLLNVEVLVCPDPARVTKLDVEVIVDPNASPPSPAVRRRVAMIRR